jgi:DNA-entry nuclease
LLKLLQKLRLPAALTALCLLLSACALPAADTAASVVSLKDLPAFGGKPYVEINGNKPYFKAGDRTTKAFESYSALDRLGRCGPAYANICREIMPTQPRGEIGQVKPTGWQIAKYDFVDGKYLYNRCHLIGFQLAGENANPKNLITGTRYLNVDGMLPFENMVADYVKETDHHVLYRVTPVFDGGNLVASGVLIEAESVEDKGAGVEFCVYCYNAQPGVTIDYAAGANRRSGTAADGGAGSAQNAKEQQRTYVLNTSSHKFHSPDCPGVAQIRDKNKKTFTGTREEVLAQGYSPCGTCKP